MGLPWKYCFELCLPYHHLLKTFKYHFLSAAPVQCSVVDLVMLCTCIVKYCFLCSDFLMVQKCSHLFLHLWWCHNIVLVNTGEEIQHKCKFSQVLWSVGQNVCRLSCVGSFLLSHFSRMFYRSWLTQVTCADCWGHTMKVLERRDRHSRTWRWGRAAPATWRVVGQRRRRHLTIMPFGSVSHC